MIVKRLSATIRNSASAEHSTSLVSADGPCRKNGGGVRSMVPMDMDYRAARRLRRVARPFTSFGGEDRSEPLHALQRHAAAPHPPGQRILGDHPRQAGFP